MMSHATRGTKCLMGLPVRGTDQARLIGPTHGNEQSIRVINRRTMRSAPWIGVHRNQLRPDSPIPYGHEDFVPTPRCVIVAIALLAISDHMFPIRTKLNFHPHETQQFITAP